jgi:small GTP-binding protein
MQMSPPSNEGKCKVRIKLQIWDTAGEERFRSVAPIYYKNAQAVILVYDTTDRESFKSLNKWIEDINTQTTELQILVIAASKCD